MENLKLSKNGMRLDAEVRNVPIGFVNGLRRILLADIPTVVISNVQILENTTQLTHEMLRHRVEMLPVNVLPTDVDVIRDTKLELRFQPSPEAREITSDDFVVAGPRREILLKDRDLGTPLYFMKLNPNESVHIKATLMLDTQHSSQVCVSTFKNHIDEEQADTDRKLWIENGGDPRVFDNFMIQRSYHKGPDGRADWFDFTVESIGVVPAKDLLRKAVDVFQGKILEWIKVPVQREEKGWYRMEMEGETFTIGQFIQEMLYASGTVEFVSRDCGHPLVPKLTVRFHIKSAMQPELVIEDFRAKAVALCESILKSV
jgi:DNA-directed RNA polymerase subunit L